MIHGLSPTARRRALQAAGSATGAQRVKAPSTAAATRYARGEGVAHSSGSGAGVSAGPAGRGGLVGAAGGLGDRIQLTPLRAHSHGHGGP